MLWMGLLPESYRGEKIIYNINNIHFSLGNKAIKLKRRPLLIQSTILNEIENVKKNHLFLEIPFILVTCCKSLIFISHSN